MPFLASDAVSAVCRIWSAMSERPNLSPRIMSFELRCTKTVPRSTASDDSRSQLFAAGHCGKGIALAFTTRRVQKKNTVGKAWSHALCIEPKLNKNKIFMKGKIIAFMYGYDIKHACYVVGDMERNVNVCFSFRNAQPQWNLNWVTHRKLSCLGALSFLLRLLLCRSSVCWS